MAGDGGDGTGEPGDKGIGEGGDKSGGGQGGGGLPFPQKDRDDAWDGTRNLPKPSPDDPNLPGLTIGDDSAESASGSTGEAPPDSVA
jgi:hypothetical protein